MTTEDAQAAERVALTDAEREARRRYDHGGYHGSVGAVEGCCADQPDPPPCCPGPGSMAYIRGCANHPEAPTAAEFVARQRAQQDAEAAARLAKGIAGERE